jgi:gamma-glutamylcyclotransferase (GGCT)/AIG2-like uncharacterized protein YtfP
MEPIFFYGTLKQGEINHLVYLNQTPLYRTKLSGYCLLSKPGTHDPAITQGEGEVISEVYAITEETLVKLDQLEQHPTLYRRTMVLVKNPEHGQKKKFEVT